MGTVVEGTGLGGVITVMGIANWTIGSWKIVSITGYEEVVAELDDTHLGSTVFEETIAASLASVPPLTVAVQWDYGEDTAFAGAATGLSVGETGDITIGLPPRTAYITAGNLTANAFINNVKLPDHTVGDRSIGSFGFKFTGKTTKPTLTKSA